MDASEKICTCEVQLLEEDRMLNEILNREKSKEQWDMNKEFKGIFLSHLTYHVASKNMT